MTEINPYEIAEALIADAIADIEHLTICERLSDQDGYDDLTEEAQDALANQIHKLIDNADVQVAFPSPQESQ